MYPLPLCINYYTKKRDQGRALQAPLEKEERATCPSLLWPVLDPKSHSPVEFFADTPSLAASEGRSNSQQARARKQGGKWLLLPSNWLCHFMNVATASCLLASLLQLAGCWMAVCLLARQTHHHPLLHRKGTTTTIRILLLQTGYFIRTPEEVDPPPPPPPPKRYNYHNEMMG